METLEATKEEKSINLSLEVLDKRESELIEMKSRYEGLTINGIEDTEGYDKVDEARKELKSARVQIEKDAKELRDPLVKMQKTIIAREGKLIDIIEPLEKTLHSKTKVIDEERARIKAEEDRKQAEKINSRISALNALNYGVDIQVITSVSDEKFEEILAEAKTEFEKAEAKRKEEARLMEIERQREVERQAELRRQEEARLEEARKEIEKRKRFNDRVGKLVGIGLIFNEKYKSYQFEIGTLSGVIGVEQVEDYSDEQFETFYSESVAGITRERNRLAEIEQKKKDDFEEEQRLVREENERKERELQARQRELDHQEEERLAKIKAEAEEKAKKERLKQEEKLRKEKEENDKKEKLLFGEDEDRFSELFKIMDDTLLHTELLQTMKSEVGKKVANDVDSLLHQAAALCKRHSKEMEKCR